MDQRSVINDQYVGRFAPSPTGPLHFGSLVTALASYLDARAHGGKWLVRVEDLDPPREITGSSTLILEQLRALGMDWDGDVLYQSTRLSAYESILEQLEDQKICFRCDCSRQRVSGLEGIYDGRCRSRRLTSAQGLAIRLKIRPETVRFTDTIQGDYAQNLEHEVGDFILRRKDGLFAYQLAVVADDAEQGITHIVRGYDLLSSTPRQIYLQQLLGLPTPSYAHIPIIVNALGQKLSKQHFAEPIDLKNASSLLFSALQFLGMTPPPSLIGAVPVSLVTWGAEHWDIQRVPKLAKMTQ
jgi:glutamyl-Q tRNA(Asp) synthetase